MNIWQIELNIPVLTFPVERAVSCIKFRPNSLLICGHFVGILTSWDISVIQKLAVHDPASDTNDEVSLLKCKYKMHAGPVFTSDFSQELNLLVSGGGDECVKLWCLTSGLLLKSLPNQEHWVLRVILIPAKSYSRQHAIICMTRNNVIKMSWPSGNKSEVKSECKATENTPDIASDSSDANVERIGIPDEISNKLCIRLNEGNNNFFTPGLQHSSKFIGLIKQDIDEKNANLCVYDIETFNLMYNISLKFKVKKLLALGNRYALLLTVGSVLYSSTLIIVDVITGEIAGSHVVPHSK